MPQIFPRLAVTILVMVAAFFAFPFINKPESKKPIATNKAAPIPKQIHKAGQYSGKMIINVSMGLQEGSLIGEEKVDPSQSGDSNIPPEAMSTPAVLSKVGEWKLWYENISKTVMEQTSARRYRRYSRV